MMHLGVIKMFDVGKLKLLKSENGDGKNYLFSVVQPADGIISHWSRQIISQLTDGGVSNVINLEFCSRCHQKQWNLIIQNTFPRWTSIFLTFSTPVIKKKCIGHFFLFHVRHWILSIKTLLAAPSSIFFFLPRKEKPFQCFLLRIEQ